MFTLSFSVAGQTVREQLQQQTITGRQPPDEQLVKVARHFKIPMAIEWLDEKPAGINFTAKVRQRTSVGSRSRQL
jgi:hypothetical protein